MSDPSGLDIEGTLSAHHELWQDVAMHGWACACGWGDGDDVLRAEADYRAHVAAVLREQIDGALAEARQGALLDAACDVFRASPFSAGSPVYRAELGDWLRDRAAHLSDTERAGDAE